jgi:hypothetical protein
MIPYIVCGIVLVGFIYHNYCLKYIVLLDENNDDNKRVDQVIEKVGAENIINQLNSDETFKKSIKELDDKLLEIMRNNKEKDN